MMDVKTLQDRIRGSLVGGAAGDALGYPLEFARSQEEIRRICDIGRQSFSGHCSGWGNRGMDEGDGYALISDDTQMTLYTAYGLLKAAGKAEAFLPCIRDAYIEWYLGQVGWRKVLDASCWLRTVPGLNERRAPGNTCLMALKELFEQRTPVNYSKGCGGVMRIAPVPLYAVSRGCEDRTAVVRLAAEASRLTHQHPLGYLPAAVLAYLILRLVTDERPTRNALKNYVAESVALVRTLYAEHSAEMDVLQQLLEKAVELSASTLTDVHAIGLLGEGWVAEETLAIALYCSLKYFGAFDKALVAAVAHPGDSDSTGAVTGNILGAAIGYAALPRCIATTLEHHDIVLRIADELSARTGS